MQLPVPIVRRTTLPAEISLLAIVFVVFATPCRAQQQGSHDSEFRVFYTKCLAAVSANNKNKITDLIAFPGERLVGRAQRQCRNNRYHGQSRVSREVRFAFHTVHALACAEG